MFTRVFKILDEFLLKNSVCKQILEVFDSFLHFYKNKEFIEKL